MPKIENEKRRNWFLDRVGTMVYRNKTKCECSLCNFFYSEGVLILDHTHAMYLFDAENAHNNEGIPFRYFETIDERDEYENLLERMNNQ